MQNENLNDLINKFRPTANKELPDICYSTFVPDFVMKFTFLTPNLPGTGIPAKPNFIFRPAIYMQSMSLFKPDSPTKCCTDIHAFRVYRHTGYDVISYFRSAFC